MAFDLAQKWVWTNWNGWNATQFMYEKYDCRLTGVSGGGGEYAPQIGFGWTNGVALQLLNLYPDRLTSSSSSTTN